MAQVGLYCKKGSYVDKDGVTKQAIRFYLQCGNTKIPVEVSYFENKELGRDPNYAGRKEVLKSYAEELPPLDE